jgi:hypothetical protein
MNGLAGVRSESRSYVGGHNIRGMKMFRAFTFKFLASLAWVGTF